MNSQLFRRQFFSKQKQQTLFVVRLATKGKTREGATIALALNYLNVQ